MAEGAGHLGVGDRLTEGPAPELIHSAFALEAGDGPLLYQGMSLADLAHAIMLTKMKLISPEVSQPLLAALLEFHHLSGDTFPFDPAQGDAYSNREYVLRQKVPAIAGWLQMGRPRREVSTLGYLIVARERLLTLVEALLYLMQSLLNLAQDNLDTVMPDYTYLQTAHPTTLAHYLLTFVQPMTRDLSRLRAVFERINLSPAGAGSTNGSRLPLDRTYLADLLGFDGVVMQTRDAMWQPDLPVEVMGMIGAMLVNIDRLAEDLQIWATAEFNFVTLADRHSRISVIMPQKKNPYSLSFVRGVAREMTGRLASVMALGATPSGQVDNRIFIYGQVPQALEHARQAVQLLAVTVSGLTINSQMMLKRAETGFGGGTDLVEVIMQQCQLDTRTAHRIVGHSVRFALESDQPLTAEILDSAAQEIIERPLSLSNDFIATVLHPSSIVNSRTGLGGAAPASVQTMINQFQTAHTEATVWHRGTNTRLETAKTDLLKTAQQIAGHLPEAYQKDF